MKEHIITGIAVIACVALCAAVWPWSAEVEDLPAVPVKTAVTGEIEARSEEMSQITLPVEAPMPETETVAKNVLSRTEITAEEKTGQALPIAPTPHVVSKSVPVSAEPKSGDKAVIDGEPHIWIPGFGWVKDDGGGAQGTTVGSPGDELTGNKVGQMGGGIIVDGKGDINKMVGIMGADDTPPSETTTPAPGSKAVIDGKPNVWIPDFGWIEDNGGGNAGNVAEDMYENGHKIGIMD